MISAGPSFTVLLEGNLVLGQYILRDLEDVLSFLQCCVRELCGRLVSLILSETCLEINEVLGCVTKVFLYAIVTQALNLLS